MDLMQMRLLHGCLTTLRFGQMVVWSWIRSLVSLLLVLGCLLTSPSTAGVAVGGAMLIMFVLILTLSAVEVFVQSLGLFNLFKGLRCGVLFLALQSSRAVHLGVDNLGVVRHVGRLLGGCRGTKPLELVNDGDLLLLIDRMLRQRGLDTVSISEVLLVRGVGWFMRFETVLFCLALLGFGALSGIRFLLLLFVMRILFFGLTTLVFWASGSLS